MSIRYLETCLPDYFQGYPGTVLCAVISPETTWEDLKNQIGDDFMQNMCGDYPGLETKEDIMAAMEEEVLNPPQFIKNITRFVEPVHEDDMDHVYCYFGIYEEGE